MTQDTERLTDVVSRRKFIAASGAVGATALAGCSGSSGGQDTTEGSDDAGSDEESTEEPTEQEDQEEDSESGSEEPLTADGSSTVYPITSQAGSLWNGNAPADDGEYWGSNGEASVPGWDQIETDKNMADYWAGLYGFEPSGEEGTPPFFTSIGLNHTGVGLEKLEKGQVDIGDASAPVSAEFPDRSEEELEPFTDHVVGVDAQPIVVSQEVYDEGVTELTLEDVQAIYRDEITNWSELGGPDRDIQAIGRAEGSGTDTSFRNNVLGDPDAEMPGVDSRHGQNQQVKTVVQEADNALAYIALAFVDDTTPAIDLEIDGERFEFPDDFGSLDYPLSRALHTYTWDGTSEKEASFIRMLLHDFGQEMFVESADYLGITDDRREEELDKLPEPTN
ncbi:substrate-binding domain-containing protein [Halorussus salilacus]|uniref:substrate-binding domain-containing protein n=1 Tax=Halorussus salilacus TaxID=2953750 RepID=UPI00209F8FBD|nr:substrate-binding domain-containing protein [Halorussus salilacus]USZ69278.1 substrate-binding domain-containing protein [Halorussus salilacus]